MMKLPPKEIIKTATYLGALSEDKGIYDTVRVFHQINRKDENWQFWIVGKGADDYIKKVKSLAMELGIYEKIEFWGFVTDTKKFQLLAKSHVLVNPSVREGWGLVNIEANAVGLPVIGYNVSGMKDSVKNGKTGILVNSGDYGAIAENILKLISDKDRYSSFQKSAISWSKKYSWDKATKESLELVESL